MSLFLKLQSQWRTVAVAGLGGGAIIYQGLDYAGVEAFLRLTGASAELFGDLQVLEGAAIAAFAEVAR